VQLVNYFFKCILHIFKRDGLLYQAGFVLRSYTHCCYNLDPIKYLIMFQVRLFLSYVIQVRKFVYSNNVLESGK